VLPARAVGQTPFGAVDRRASGCGRPSPPAAGVPAVFCPARPGLGAFSNGA